MSRLQDFITRMATLVNRGGASTGTDTAEPIKPRLEHFFKTNNMKWELRANERGNSYVFSYQGGHFVGTLFAQETGVEVCYPSFLDIPYDEINIARSLCNRFNNATTNYKFTYSADEQENKIRFYIEFCLNRFDPEAMEYLMGGCFTLQRDFSELYQKQREDLPDPELNALNNAREQFLLRELEIRHNPNNQQHRANPEHAMQLGHAIEQVLEIRDIVYKRLTITRSNGDTTILTDGKLIHRYDLAHAVIDGNGPQAAFAADYATLVLDYFTADSNDINRLTIFVADAGQADNTLYLRLNLTMLPPTAAPCTPLSAAATRSVSLLAAYDKTSDKQRQQEFDYMYADAKIKQKNGDKLSDEEQLMLNATTPHASYCAYWGHKHLLNGQYLDALNYLLPLYDAFQPANDETTAVDKSNFFEICYYIGLCYTRLQAYKQAFYYLDVLARTGNIRHTQLLVDALVEAHDFRAFELIDHIVKSISENFAGNNDEDMPEHIVNFLRFLHRRRAQALIDFGRYDDATNVLMPMLKDPDCSDFAKQLLGQIAKQKAKLQDITDRPTADDSTNDLSNQQADDLGGGPSPQP